MVDLKGKKKKPFCVHLAFCMVQLTAPHLMLSCSFLADRLQSVDSPKLFSPLSLNSTFSFLLPPYNLPLKVAAFVSQRVAAELFYKTKERISKGSRGHQDRSELFLRKVRRAIACKEDQRRTWSEGGQLRTIPQKRQVRFKQCHGGRKL